ncbi:hypothetical protein CLV78_101563 [Aliiruegeria haliotis]|uniref:Uncharacterized protein n=1 Tax=Aliiruegeria haliotis TaxID=1280846 RepID=A0A2T0RZ70_9RHOB|nr:hypothetical protein [Aliiruegeria haliotis]PRY26467.1 hypothetical protein CLV78_101563 [Aliiruegeria haliotis]
MSTAGRLTRGQRWATGLAVAATGAIYGLVMVWNGFAGLGEVDGDTTTALIWMTGSAWIGALLAGTLCAPLFGRADAVGWLWSLLGWTLASLLGGAIGGTFVLPVYGTLFGPLFVFGNMVETPWLLPLWLVLIVPTHLRARQLRNGTTAGAG